MATYIPIPGAFTSYAARFIDPSLGFAMGWIYWFSWAMTFSLELTATGLIIQYWAPNFNIAYPIIISWVFMTALNLLPVKFFGECEFWFSTVKVITVVGFIIFAIVVDLGGGPTHDRIGFRYWKEPGAFASYLVPGAVGKFVGFWAVLIQAGFSYQGTELVGIAAGETENPRKNVPAAIKKTFYRILFFFVLTIFCIGLLVPYDNTSLLSDKSDATASPFVIAAQLANVPILPHIINGVLLFVVLSAANSNVYSGSRILLGLANDGSAPKIFAKTNKHGVPIAAVCLTAAFGLLAFLNCSKEATTVFNWFLNITGVAGFITWACINACHLAFMRALAAQNISRDSLPYKAHWQPWFAWYGLGFNCLIILTQGFTAFIPWDVSSFFAAYISVLLFVVLYVGHKIVKKTKFVVPEEADVDTGCMLHDTTDWSDEAQGPKSAFTRFCEHLC